MRVISMSWERERRRVAGRPPKPPPTTTTRCGVPVVGLIYPLFFQCSGAPRRSELGRVGPLRLDQSSYGVDQGQVGKRLREVSQMLPGGRVDLFGVELQGSREVQQLLAQGPPPRRLADHAERRGEPEGADGEGALLALEAGVGGVDLVAQYEPVLGQLVGDGQHGRAYPLVVQRQEPEDGDQQQRGVELVVAVVLAEPPALVDPLLED